MDPFMQNNQTNMNSNFSVDIYFHFGLPGFENINDYSFEHLDEVEPFNILRARHDPKISLLLFDARLLPLYCDIPISEMEKKKVELKVDETPAVFLVLKIDSHEKRLTANLRAPIIFNFDTKMGHQLILEDETLSMEYVLEPETVNIA